MSLRNVLRQPEFPINQPVMVRLEKWEQFETGTIYSNGQREHMVHDTVNQNFLMGWKNMYRFQDYIISAYTPGIEVKLIDGTAWSCWDRIFVPKAYHGPPIEPWPMKSIENIEN